MVRMYRCSSGWCCKEVHRFPHITYPYFTLLAPFCSSIPTSLFIKKKFFSFLFMLFLCIITVVAQRTFEIVQKSWPTDSISFSVMDSCYEGLKEDVLTFGKKEKTVLLGDLNARIGRSAQLDGMFGENMCNASGSRLLSFLNEVELMICNGRTLVSEPEWARVPNLKQKLTIDYHRVG